MISVCIATYNGEKYIQQQLESILLQLEQNDEIVVSDDGSTDNTLRIIDAFNDERIKVYINKKDESLKNYPAASFRYAAKNFENAINRARGEYIYLSDQDDVWKPDRIKKTKPFLSEVDMVMCNYGVIDETGLIINDKLYTENPVSHSLLRNMFSTPFLGCCMAFRREVLSYCFPFPKACIGHDYWIGCMVLHIGTFKFIEEPLHLYRKHNANVSPATSSSKNPFWFKIQYRIDFLFQVLKRSITYKK